MIAKAVAVGPPGYGPLPAAAAQVADAADGEEEDGGGEVPDLEAKYDKAPHRRGASQARSASQTGSTTKSWSKFISFILRKNVFYLAYYVR